MNYKNELRLIITSKCNYQCWFCHKEGISLKSKKVEMTAEEIAFLFETYKNLTGNPNITITGGEPCIRSDICDIIDLLIQKGATITLTTNGTLLSKLEGREKYIDKFNISFHACNKQIYEEVICKKDTFEKAQKALFDFRAKNHLAKITLNCTVLNNVNSDDKSFFDLISFAEQLNASVKFIEMYPPYSESYYPLNDKNIGLEERGFVLIERLPRKVRYQKNNIQITLSTIFCIDAWNKNDVCNYCHEYNDLFISADGGIKPCRESSFMFNIKSALEKKDANELINILERSYLSLGSYCNIKKFPDNFMEIISLTKGFVKNELLNESTGHDYYHTMRVLACSKKLATNKNINSFFLEMIALLHDVDDYKTKSVNKVFAFLQKIDLHPMYIFNIMKANYIEVK